MGKVIVVVVVVAAVVAVVAAVVAVAVWEKLSSETNKIIFRNKFLEKINLGLSEKKSWRLNFERNLIFWGENELFQNMGLSRPLFGFIHC